MIILRSELRIRIDLYIHQLLMKRHLVITLAVAMLAFGIWSCKSFDGAKVTVKPDPIEVHADSIKYEVTAVVPPKSGMKKGGTYTGDGFIGNSNQGKVVISSDKYPSIKKYGMDTILKFNRPFTDDMDGNFLMVKQKYERKGKSFELPNLDSLAACCITTSRLVWQNDQYLWAEYNHNYVKQVPLTKNAVFNFPKDVFKIQEDQYNKGDIKDIGDFISKKYPATKITVVGFASPEGPFERNVKLSVNRSKEVIEWLKEQLKTAGYTQYLDSTFFDITTTSEDWEGFKSSLKSQYPDKAGQITDIISNGNLSEDEKENQILALVGGKDKVENILAPLRRATIVISGFEPRKTDAQIDSITALFIAGKFTGDLKSTFEQEEWMYAITRVKDNAGKKTLLTAFNSAYPSDIRALNDLGVIALMEKNIDGAMTYLQKAASIKATDYMINNNLGVAYLNKKDYRLAKDSFESSLTGKSTPEANFNMGVVLEKMAMYNQAIDKFTSAKNIKGSDYNIGLCKMMLGDLGGAKSSLETNTKNNPEYALGFYLLAVQGARSGDNNTLIANLKKACTMDSSLKQKAMKDLEFRKYWNSSDFKVAIQ